MFKPALARYLLHLIRTCFMNPKKIKPIHWIYNLFHYRAIKHNKAAYRKYNLHKPLIASVSSKDFPDKESKAWLDIEDSMYAASLKDSFNRFPAAVQQQIRSWSANGYMILENLFDDDICDKISQKVDSLIKNRKLRFNESNKLMFANRKSAFIKTITEDKSLKPVLEFILDKEVVAFQTINFFKGSGQRAHSDSVHMTTYPLGYLIAAWVALEDVSHENGPLFYYPGSHKLPYLLNSDFNEGETALRLGKKEYVDYEDVTEELLKNHPFEKKEFHAKKGDVLIWHANLIHGGAPIVNPNSTRKSMVIHYYATDVIKYHEITERPSLLED
jgi:ectoine hydroxylase-related dioxygenase (phytanoyl-CoA dioxygenase family)